MSSFLHAVPTTFAATPPADYLDVIDLLLEQHDEIREMCAGVERSRGEERERRFAELAATVRVHERGERAVVHPATRAGSPAGNLLGLSRMLEEDAIERSVAGLQVLGARHPDFDRGFAALYHAILDHATREELDEFPLLRDLVPVQRLHVMAGELYDVQAAEAG
ncbi:hemerythrin domain-containing protein [Actinoplanes teichomyceticus]|uniref:Hemerythrin HHE cation binding domain-containing protein n=1 Tax=Actinoplanes teichomyceticus TaxID=1867 RepID=A0A561VIX3_ACTTI|nr:hemerythrin domain-containing protein [Actinoplanes teichomyceticus]TWG11563.1 hemerythrin HHE cation binding domain-containing protein [Actinoplanes teichomyceticus]GIF16009.1 hypothetical protein Ate01nite_60410 [Actinoplanes teichomyceticus]